jgi:hypothetical protein
MLAILYPLRTFVANLFKSRRRLEVETDPISPCGRVFATQCSIATIASAWLRKNVRQVCDGGLRCRIMYLETVDSAISNPSLSNSPWMRGAPHNGRAEDFQRQ